MVNTMKVGKMMLYEQKDVDELIINEQKRNVDRLMDVIDTDIKYQTKIVIELVLQLVKRLELYDFYNHELETLKDKFKL
jgi:hypothetical protein